MTKSQKKTPKKKKAKTGAEVPLRRGRLKRWFWSLVLVGLLLYVSTFLIVGTDGFRSTLAEKIGSKIDMPLSIGSSRVTLGLDLVLQNLATESDPLAGQGGVRIDNLRVNWSMAGFFSKDLPVIKAVFVERCDLAFAPTKDGKGWSPALLDGLGGWVAKHLGLEVGDAVGGGEERNKESEESLKISAEALSQLHWVLEDATVTWWDKRGRQLASAKNLDVFATPLQLRTRNLTHYEVAVEEIRSQRAVLGTHMRVEILQGDGETVILGFETQRQRISRHDLPKDPGPAEVVDSVPVKVNTDPVSRARPAGEAGILSGDAEEAFTEFIRDTLEVEMAK